MVEEPYFDSQVLRDLQEWAGKTFTAVPSLRALAFGRNYKKPWFLSPDDVEFEPPYYMRGKLIDVRGVEKPAAIEVSLDELEQLEPVCGILKADVTAGEFLRYGYEA